MKMTFFFFIVFSLLVSSIPFLLSCPKNQQWVNGYIKKTTGGKIEIEKSEFSWFGPQRFTNLKYQKTLDQEPLNFNTLTIEQSLPLLFFHLLKKDPDLAFSFHSEKLSTQAVGSILKIDPIIQKKLPSIIGPEIQVNGSIEPQNHLWRFNLTAKSHFVQMAAIGQVENGILTLSSPLKAAIVATPEFTKEILQSLVPLIDSPLTAAKPIAIEIDAKGFSMPLQKFKIKDLQIGRAMLDLGQIELERPQTLTKMIKKLNPDKNLDNEPVHLWFSPAYFHLENGSLELKRLDILFLKEYPIAIWGSVDLLNDHLQMTLGIPPKVLGKSLAKNLFKGKELLPIPLVGTIKKPSINFDALLERFGDTVKWLFQEKGSNTKDNIPPPISPLPWEEKS